MRELLAMLVGIIVAGPLAYEWGRHSGWMTGFRKRGEMDDDFLEQVTPLIERRGWLKGSLGKPLAEDAPAKEAN